MEQRLYHTVNAGGISGIVTGVVALVAGAACTAIGVLSLVNGAKLLSVRKYITI